MTGTASARRALVPDDERSQLSLHGLELAAGARAELGEAEAEADTLVYVTRGEASVELDGRAHRLAGRGAAGLVLAGERARLDAGAEGVDALEIGVGRGGHLHAPMGERAVAVDPARLESGAATGKRSFELLFGPHNGCLYATLFTGHIPPGAATLHYHLYDEIVWVADGPGRLHLGGEQTPLAAGSAFRLAPEQRHIVENLRERDEMTVLGVFTPAGSPSAAYLDQ